MVTLEKQRQRPSFPDRLIYGREALLNRLAGVGPELVLNPVSDHGGMAPPTTDLAAKIKETLDELNLVDC